MVARDRLIGDTVLLREHAYLARGATAAWCLLAPSARRARCDRGDPVRYLVHLPARRGRRRGRRPDSCADDLSHCIAHDIAHNITDGDPVSDPHR